MPNYKVEFKFTAQSAGWIEVFYINKNNVSTALAAAKTIAPLRMNMCGAETNVALDEITVESVPLNLVPEQAFDNKEYVSSATYKTSASDMPSTGALFALRTSAGNRRSFVARGVPDIVTVAPFSNPIVAPNWVAAKELWVVRLLTDQWRMKVLNKIAGPLVVVTGIAANADGSIVVTAPAHGFSPISYLVWERIDAQGACFAGRHRVQVVDPDTLLLRQYNAGPIRFVAGNIRQLSDDYLIITSVVQTRVGERPTGASHNNVRARRVTCRHY